MTPGADTSTLANHFAPPRVEYRTPLGQRLFSLFGVIVLGCITTAMMIFSVVLMFGPQWWFGLLIVAPLACFMAGLTGYVGRDLRGKLGLRVLLDGHSMTLDLPGGRSLIHRPPAQHMTISYADVAAIETRLEAYPSLGMEMIQRAYVLRRKSGELMFLFEDRALGTGLASSVFPRIVSDMAARAGVRLDDLGMVEGKGGVLAVWGAHSPDWAAPSLPLALQLRIWRHVATTGTLAMSVIIVMVVLQRIFGTG